jgi:hypothetical protein
MKKTVLTFLLIGLLVAASSCVTKRRNSSWNEYPPIPFFYQYQVGSVVVIVDHVREVNIAQQLCTIAETCLESQQKYALQSDKTFILDITVEQRSFMQNVEMYNSIFVSCFVHDEEGNIYARENEYITGKKTFIDAAEQNTIMTRILNRILSSQQKRYNDIQKYEKTLAK